MSTENNGLRFDIYERVNLPENVAAIAELEEIELIPRIQVIDQGEVVLLQGQLVLNGIYRGEGFGQEQIALEHWIPVEISLPMSRVQQLEEITVDIDTFHVEPVSERALNITGVLALRGIYLEEQEQHWEQQSEYEELSFVAESNGRELEQNGRWHIEAQEPAEESQAEWFVENQQASQEQEQLAQEWRDFAQTDLSSEGLHENTEETAEEINTAEQYELEAQWEQTEVEQDQPLHQEQEEYSFREEAIEHAAVESDFEASHEEQGYYSEADYSAINESESNLSGWQNSQSETAKVTTSFGIKDLLSSSLREQAVHDLARLEEERERIQQRLLNEQNQSDPIEWRQMLLQADGREQFRTIKMYIVQKNDTLELIAGKYSINPRDLLNHNKLHETTINEGQLLYIP